MGTVDCGDFNVFEHLNLVRKFHPFHITEIVIDRLLDQKRINCNGINVNIVIALRICTSADNRVADHYILIKPLLCFFGQVFSECLRNSRDQIVFICNTDHSQSAVRMNPVKFFKALRQITCRLFKIFRVKGKYDHIRLQESFHA